jgi:hypothetical protein
MTHAATGAGASAAPLPPPPVAAMPPPTGPAPSLGRRLLHRAGRAVKLFALAVLCVILFVIYIAYRAHGPNGEALHLTAGQDTGLVNGELDHGVRVKFDVHNIGDDGRLVIRPWLSCSDGQWEREQSYDFKADQTVAFDFFFPEPTINSANIHYGVKISRK